MKARKKLGLDKWKVQMDASAFLHICKQGNLELYDITIHQREIQFYTSVLQRHTIYRLLPKAVLLTTTGMLGYLLRSMVTSTSFECGSSHSYLVWAQFYYL